MDKNNQSGIRHVIALLAVLALVHASYLALRHAGQPLLEAHSFRQTQTALTAYWMMQEGFKLAYETPVAGPPWSIPFEFPLYQWMAATLARLTGAPLDKVGRLLSYAFLLLILWPAGSITRRLGFDRKVFLIFAALLLSSPLYVFWGRSFMIETAALCLAVFALKFFVDMVFKGFAAVRAAGFAFFMSLCILQKATTGLPVLAVLLPVFVLHEIKRGGGVRAAFSMRALVAGLLCFAVPLAIGVAWVHFTDVVKQANPLGKSLTAAALTAWNWGTVSQRISHELLLGVLWKRVASRNLGGVIGLLLVLAPFVLAASRRVRVVMLTACAMGLLPLFLFTNLHIVHDYYQSANVLFLVYALAVSLGAAVMPILGERWGMLALVLVMASNYWSLYSRQVPAMQLKFGSDNVHWSVGRILNRELAPDMQFIAFGNDWSSTFAYLSQRRSFTVPVWVEDIKALKAAPESGVDKGKLGALVVCNSQVMNFQEVLSWAASRSWKVGEANGCAIAVPSRALSSAGAVASACKAHIERAVVEQRDGAAVLVSNGWAVTADGKGVPGQVFVRLSSATGAQHYFEALKVPRKDVNDHFGLAKDMDPGFSLVMPAKLTPGEYQLDLVQVSENQQGVCGSGVRLVIGN